VRVERGGAVTAPGAVEAARGGKATDRQVAASTAVASWEGEGLKVRWRGFAFTPGERAGAPSIARFAARAAREGAEHAAGDLRGLYFATVEDEARRATYAFVDPSAYFHAFHSAEGAGDDFLSLARGAGELDPEAAAELVTQGQVAFGRTPLASVRRIAGGEVVAVPWAGGEATVIAKRLPPLDERPAEPLLAQLEAMVPALEGRRISLDLTGGLDTRLVAVALARFGVPFETATVGRSESTEARIAARVAAALGREHHVVGHRPETLADELDELLLSAGCLVSPLVSHRELQLQRDRARRGVDLVVHGLGGEGLKDFFWQQDFPRYWGGGADLERLWRMRIERPQAHPAPLAGAYAAAAAALPAAYVQRLERYRMPLRTQTYDRIFFEMRSQDVNGRGLTLRSQIVPTFAPLIDRDVQRLGYCLPRRARVFNGFHRRLLTQMAPEIARIPTTDGGMSASSRPAALPADAARWVGSKAWRLAKKKAPARLRPLPAESPLPPLNRLLRTLPVLDASVERLVAAGVFRPGTTATDLADGHLGGTVALARLLEEI
jgi:Asparagine synthase